MKRRQKNCWETKSNLEKILIFITAILLCFILAIIVVLLLQYVRKDQLNCEGRFFQNLVETENTSSTCMTPQCVQAAAQIMDFIDPSIDPCNNFYGFTCGTFLKKSIGKKESSTFSNLMDIVTNRLDALITQPSTEPTEKPLELQRKFYRSCLNTTAINTDEKEALLKFIVDVGEWPLRLGNLWNSQKFKWFLIMVKCRNLGVNFDYFMRITVTEKTINGTEMMLLSITPPKLNNLSSKIIEDYVELMTEVSMDLGATLKEAASAESFRVLRFKNQIKEFIQDQEDNGHESIIQLADLQDEYPAIPWVKLLNNITNTATVRFTNESLVHFAVDIYLYRLLDLLDVTPETTQANYVIWTIVESYTNYWNKTKRALYNLFLTSLNLDLQIDDNREAFCLSEAKYYFPSVAEAAYIRKYIHPEVRGMLTEMTKEIQNQLITRMQKNDWLDDKSKISAEAKVKEMQWLAVASDSIFYDNFEKVVKMEEFDIETDIAIEMTQKLNKRRTDNYFRLVNRNLSDVVNEALETSAVLEIDDFYKKVFNIIVLSASILQSIIYNFDHPQYMNYGAVGSLIGYKFTHDLISQGNQKNLSKVSWPYKTQQEYEKRIDCLLDEYENYTRELEGFANDGTVVLAETLADSVGLSLAYEAYHKWVQYHPQEENLPGLNYTQNQIFWIMFGAIRCHQPRFNNDYPYGTDDRIPFTVEFSVKNSPDFAKDFECSIKSEMNPPQKCRIL